MGRHEGDVRPATRALDTLIRETVSQACRQTTDGSGDALLFLGNRHQAFPLLLVQDPVLEPVDKVVWMVICQQGRAIPTGTAFPRYDAIARHANIASTSTVSRAIAILRVTRWLSLCARVRDDGGRYRGNVYALHDEPLPLADALHLDAEYMAFLRAVGRHHHARVRKVAAAVLASLDEEIATGVDVLAPTNGMERRLEAAQAVHQAGARRYFSFSAAVLARLTNQDQKSKAVGDRLRILSPQISKSVRSSSSYINKTTTTTDPTSASNADAGCAPLIYPHRLSANQLDIAARYLERVDAGQRQAVLDELEGRFRAERQGARPIYDELRYLHHLCSRAHSGGFQPNLGIKVREARERDAAAAAHQRQEAAARARDHRRRLEQVRAGGESPLAEARRLLGMPPRGAKPDRRS
ncbi:MAG: STY4528 family pathogenicity island replication protein [Gammaproteobacteria bacterium]|nr:STY4528 family pathogenicity island replication protein [Gammaproteobacteria bacterium]